MSRYVNNDLGRDLIISYVYFQFTINGISHIGEVLYYFLLKIHGAIRGFAVVAQYGPPNWELYNASSKTYWTAQHLRDAALAMIDIKAIDAVVMMAPDQRYAKMVQDGTETDRWYLTEKPGSKLSSHWE